MDRLTTEALTVKEWVESVSECSVVYDDTVVILFQNVNKGMFHFRVPVFHVQMDAVYSGKKVAEESSTTLYRKQKKISVVKQFQIRFIDLRITSVHFATKYVYF